MPMPDEIIAVADVLIDGRDFLANAVDFYGTTNPHMIHDDDAEMVAALTQAVDALHEYADLLDPRDEE